MKKDFGRRSVFIFGILFITNLSFAQNDLKRYHSFLFIPSSNHKKSKEKAKVEAVFKQNQPFFLQYSPKKSDCFYLLASQTSYCFDREIDMVAMSRRTKTLFFKMKMWQYFR